MAQTRIFICVVLVVAGVAGFALPNAAPATSCEAILGKWAWFIGGEVTVNRDGTFTQQSGNAGTWECNDGARGRVTLRWRDGGFVNSLAVSPDGQGLTSTDQSQLYVTARRSAPAPPSPLVQQEDCCREAYGCETQRIEAEFAQKVAQCRGHPGNATCFQEAVSTKAAQLQAASEKLRLCYRAASGEVIGPVPGSGGPVSLPGSSDEFHSTDRPGFFSQECVCTAVQSPEQTASGGGDTFGSHTPGSDQGPPPRGPGETFGSDAPGSGKGQPPTQSKPTPTPSPGTGQQAQSDCVPEADPQTQTRLRKTGIEALDTMAAMGQQADRTLDAMGQFLTAELAYLAQPNAKIWNDRTEAMKAGATAIVEYFANDTATNHERLRKAAERAAQDFRRDPAEHVGAAAAAILTGKAVLSVGSICKAVPARLKAATAAAAKAEKAADRYNDVLKSQLELERTIPNPCTNPVNPTGLRNACHTSTWAEILTEETWHQWTALNFKEVVDDVGTPWDQIYRVQKAQWGDRRFANLTPLQALMQAWGKPRRMAAWQMVKELRDAGDGAEGIVTVVRQNGSAHTFRGKNINGQVRFKEAGGGPVADFEGNNPNAIQEIFLYRTNGQDWIR